MIQQSPTAIHHHQFSSQNITELIQNPSVPVSNTPLKASTNPWGFAPWQLRGPLSSLQARLARQKLMVFVHPLPAWSGEEIWPKFLVNLFKEKDGRFVCHYQLLDVRFFFESQVSSSSFCWGWVDWGGIRIVLWDWNVFRLPAFWVSQTAL